MKNRHRVLAIAAGIGALTALAGPAAADSWWETDLGTMAWADTVNGAAVFTFDGQAGAVFIDGIGGDWDDSLREGSSIDDWSGTFTGWWYDSDGTDLCSQARTDGYGQITQYWGQAQITFVDFGHFTLSLGACDGPMTVTIDGTPGVLR